jgi:peptidoglycan/LPS O-acetylase OafA/YrhL
VTDPVTDDRAVGHRAYAGPPQEPLPAVPLDAARGEIRALTGLRFFAALYVIAFHFQFTRGDAYARILEPFQPLIESGALGVDLFFVLSGFVIAHVYARTLGPGPRARAVGSFLWARFSRIWPVYALVTIGFGLWLLVRAHFDKDGIITVQALQPSLGWRSWVAQLLMVQLWNRPVFHGASFSGPSWSISAEWLAYVAFPVLILFAWRLRHGRPGILAFLALIPLLPQVWIAALPADPPFMWAMRIAGGFSSGVLIWLAVRRIPPSPRVSRVAAGIAVAALVEIGLVLGWSSAVGISLDRNGVRGLAIFAFPVLIGALALSDRGPAAALSHPWAVHGGRISYSLYLIHLPIFELYWTAMANIPAFAPGTALAAFLSPHVLLLPLVAAHILWRFVEEPARRWLRTRDPFRHPAPAPASLHARGRRAGRRLRRSRAGWARWRSTVRSDLTYLADQPVLGCWSDSFTKNLGPDPESTR